MKTKIQVRFNTKFEEAPDKALKWRVLIDGKEHLASKVTFLAPSFTSEDVIETGETKWHLTVFGQVSWSGSEVIVSE